MAFDFPASPIAGQQFTPISGGPTYVWQSPVWRLASGGVNTGVWIGDTPPLAPVQGMLWYESDSGNTFIYFDDGTSAQWVQFNIAPPPVLTPDNAVIFAVSGTYTKPAGLTALLVEGVGGGGAGGGTPVPVGSQDYCGTGGGAGGYARKLYRASDLAATVAVTVGAGGTAVVGGSGGAGGASGFAAAAALTMGAGGGGTTSVNGGSIHPSATSRGTGGIGAGGDINSRGGYGGWGIIDYAAAAGWAGDGGASVFGPGGPGNGPSGGGAVALTPGAGGAGAYVVRGGGVAFAGGTGGTGLVIATEYF